MAGSAGPETATGEYLDARSEFADIDDGGHMALFYDDRESQLSIAAAFVATALGRNRKCLYLADEHSHDRIRAAFEEAGIDVDARVEAVDLRIRDATEVYLSGGFSAEELIGILDETSRASLETGYDGLTVAGENTWSFRTDETFDRIIDFEIDFDHRCPDMPATTLCQYDVDRFSEESLAKAIRTHEHIVYRGTVCENPYYVPPETYAEGGDGRANARLMLEQTYELARSRREVERSEQRLSVVNRVLRHNIRNDLNIVLGNLERLRREHELDDDARSLLETIETVAENAVDRARKARHVEETMEESTVEPIRLGPTIDAAVDRASDRYPGADISVTGTTDRVVIADEALEQALVELLTNAIVHQESGTPAAELVVEGGDDDPVSIEVRNDGGRIPEMNRRVLVQEEESPLDHGFGLGLWLVKWIAENSGADLRFPESEGESCRVRIEFRPMNA
ncbi:MAG: MEDS domain-containing protein [Haloarculaceae archaeon]